ncbi:hypothetical protein Golax_016783 [Gossypium laxum]|uniref:Myb/SANT-like domain-containing protein n=1 Tax=Gossypium laxum TaxID=34288 RepID=A0A7J8YY82_9ROSI|nr:hypothetical protein [Gossypium laxum]
MLFATQYIHDEVSYDPLEYDDEVSSSGKVRDDTDEALVSTIKLQMTKPHIDNKLRTLSNEWSVLHGMIYGKHTNEFGWNSTRKVIIVEQAIWDEFLKSHKNVASFKNRTSYFKDFSKIYGKDRATGKDTQIEADIIEELEEDEDDNGRIKNNANGTGVGETNMTGTKNFENEKILKTMASQGPHLLIEAKLEWLKKLERIR